jgi:putative SOS response-associated peptidase YedK
MPVILPPESYASWLDTSIQEPDELMPLLVPYPSQAMEAYPVSTHVTGPPTTTQGAWNRWYSSQKVT